MFVSVSFAKGNEAFTFSENVVLPGVKKSINLVVLKGDKDIATFIPVSVINGTNSVPVAHSELWFPKVVAGQFIKKGAILGELKGYFGNTLETVSAPYAGCALYGLNGPAVKKGQSVMTIAKPISKLEP